jgi:hypothetical protein
MVMHTAEEVLVIIAAACAFIFFLLLCALVVYVWVTYRKVLKTAQSALSNVETATRHLKDYATKSPFGTIVKIIKLLFKTSHESR